MNFAAVYMDLVPDNLAALSEKYAYRCLVLPIVCAEYYYLKCLGSVGLCRDIEVHTCVECRRYPSAAWLATHNNQSYSNYERLCKLFAERSLYSCASISRTGRVKKSHHYTLADCLCIVSKNVCGKHESSLERKALAYVSSFPYPPYIKELGKRKATERERWEVHRRCVAAFNRWSEELSGEGLTCFKIRPIR